MADFTLRIPVSFGDCDPAGIVFYPNYYRWFDRCFHTFLRSRTYGHRTLCAELGALGMGLMDTGASFPAPATDGDALRLELTLAEWRSKSLRLTYHGYVEDRLVVDGFELRGLFVMQDGRLRAADVAAVRARLDMG